MKQITLFMIMIAATIVLSACSTQVTNDTIPISDKNELTGLIPSIDLLTECETQGGNWIESVKECEHISATSCEDLGGTFNECASACRNDPEAVVCTAQCVFVCEFDAKDEVEQAVIEEFHIESQLKDCVGVGPMKCLVVNGNYFYDSIVDFEFVAGNEYDLRVERTTRENVPADANKYVYTLIEIVSQEKITVDDGILGSHDCSIEEKESMICTREYMPVCGDDGVTYSNGCTACGSGNINSWIVGDC